MAGDQKRGFWVRWVLLMAAIAGGLYLSTATVDAAPDDAPGFHVMNH